MRNNDTRLTFWCSQFIVMTITSPLLTGISVMGIAQHVLLLGTTNAFTCTHPHRTLNHVTLIQQQQQQPCRQRSSSLNTIAVPNDAFDIPTKKKSSTSLNDDDDNQISWARNLDYAAFAAEVTALGKEIQKSEGLMDVAHMKKILLWRDTAAVVGLLTMALPAPNPLSIVALSTWTYASWTMIAHHTCHGGYNRVEAGKYNSKNFGIGTFRRFLDWCDWMLPEAWNVEHNKLHHYHLSEDKDPDLVQRNLEFLREMNVPMVAKYAIVALLVPIWKWFYYAPNTYKELQLMKMKKEDIPEGVDTTDAVTLRTLFFPKNDSERAVIELIKPQRFLIDVLAPFLLTRFVLLPLPLLFLPSLLPSSLLPFSSGPALFQNAITNILLAELLTNIHAFITIVTNHAGNDLYEFQTSVKPRSGSFYVRQIVSSADYPYGNDVVDFWHGWLNYQVEHHVWPDMSMLGYQKAAPRLREICERYGVPYVQENVWTRTKKTVDVMVGKASMKVFPKGIEPEEDQLVLER